ncbi:MAG: hypothetical protein ACXVJT_06735 [Thermoanaerobaculia bacterium]
MRVKVAAGLLLLAAATAAAATLIEHRNESKPANSAIERWIAITDITNHVVFVRRGREKAAAFGLHAKLDRGRWIIPIGKIEKAILDVISVSQLPRIPPTTFDKDKIVVLGSTCKLVASAYNEPCQASGNQSAIVEHYDDYQCVKSTRQEDVCLASLMGNNGRILLYNNPTCAGAPVRKIPTSEAEGVRCTPP